MTTTDTDTVAALGRIEHQAPDEPAAARLNQSTVRISGVGTPAGCIGAIERIRRSADRTGRIRAIVRQVLRRD